MIIKAFLSHVLLAGRPARWLGDNETQGGCRKAHYVEDGRFRMCECDLDCNHENNFCAEGLTCGSDGVCRDSNKQNDCSMAWLMYPPNYIAILVILIVSLTIYAFLRLHPWLVKRQVGTGGHVSGTTDTATERGMSPIDANIPVARIVDEIEFENVRHTTPSTLYTTEKVPATC